MVEPDGPNDGTDRERRKAPSNSKRKQHNGICTYCGSEGPVTKDHVFARTLFLTRTENMITVPACQACHSTKNVGEEALRTFVNTEINGSQHPDALQHLEKAARATQRKQSRIGRAIVERSYIQDYITGAGIYLGPVVAVPTDDFREVILTTVKYVIRGLYFHETGNRLPVATPVEAAYLEPDRIQTVFKGLQQIPNTHIEMKGNHVAGWVSWRFPDSPLSTQWLLGFNNRVFFLGWTGTLAEGRREYVGNAKTIA